MTGRRRGDIKIEVEMPAHQTGKRLYSSDGLTYTADETEFIKAMERYKHRYNRPFPTWHEVLSVVKSLGYAKTQTADNPPPEDEP